jgi:GT2 family glycosyltransferase
MATARLRPSNSSIGAHGREGTLAPAVAAVVVTYNSADVIGDCLDALRRALVGVERAVVVVADNASHDDTCDFVERTAPDAHVLRLARNAGYAAGVNAGVAATRDADAWLVLNADVRMMPGSVQALLDALSTPGTGVAVPRLLGSDDQFLPSLKRESTVLRALGEAVLGGHVAGRFAALGEMDTRPQRYETPRTVDWASGAVMLIDRRCYGALGGWDETFFHGSEETDFCHRARDRGWTIRYTPEAVAVHLGGGGARSSTLRPIMFANRLELYRRRRGPRRAIAFRLALALNEALRLHRGPQHRATLRALLTGRAPRSQPESAL